MVYKHNINLGTYGIYIYHHITHYHSFIYFISEFVSLTYLYVLYSLWLNKVWLIILKYWRQNKNFTAYWECNTFSPIYGVKSFCYILSLFSAPKNRNISTLKWIHPNIIFIDINQISTERTWSFILQKNLSTVTCHEIFNYK